MGALCNFALYLDYSALIFLSGQYLYFSLLRSICVCVSKQLNSNSYIARIVSLQGNHGYFFHKNKNWIRQSWKIYRVKYSYLLLYCSIPTIHLFFLCYTTHYMGNEIFIENEKICVQPLKNMLEAIQKLQQPKTPKGCRSFAGVVNFLSMFCPELQKLLKPIYDLTRKRRPLIGEKNSKIHLKKSSAD